MMHEIEQAEDAAPAPRVFYETRNAMSLPGGMIDCEINHPEFGWIPTTVDRGEDGELFDHIVGNSTVASYVPPEGWRDGCAGIIRAAVESVVVELAGRPSPSEIASWPNKIEAARRVVSGEAKGEVILAPTAAKFGLDMKGAAQVVLLRCRLYELAKAVAETTQAAALSELAEATPEKAPELLSAFMALIEERKAEFGAIRAAAMASDCAPLEAAEQKLMGA